jgi:hypothetical protein
MLRIGRPEMKEERRGVFGHNARKGRGVVCLVILAALATSCGLPASKKSAEQAVLTFRSQMDSEQYDDIYKNADAGFRENQTQDEIVSFLRAVHNKLGKVVSASPRGFGVNTAIGSGTRVALSYETRFEGGKGAEEFVWHVTGGKTLLIRYSVTSLELVTK